MNALKAHVDEEDKMGWQITTPSRGEHGVEPLIINSKLKIMNNELINFHHEMFGDFQAIERRGTVVRGKRRG